jgi:hypothetical protein
MVFLKPLEELKFADIEQLKNNKICESQILDYKKQLLADNKLLKQVSAFANTQGGFLIFGVEETGKGGHPKEILGMDKAHLNKERMEQIILGNIQPRLNVKMQVVKHQDPSKVILVVQIPNSYLKPHMNSHDNKFYKRYEFEALPMTEMEVNNAYKRRFTGYQELESYIAKLLKYDFWEGAPVTGHRIIGKIIIVPTLLKRLVDPITKKSVNWTDELDFRPKQHTVFTASKSRTPIPSPNGLKYQFIDRNDKLWEGLEIHRNGCVHSISGFSVVTDDDKVCLHYPYFCFTLLHAFQFVSALFQKHNYFGDVKIVCNLRGIKDSYLRQFDERRLPFRRHEDFSCQTDQINVVREFPTKLVESEYEYITSEIMDEIFNCYGLWKCPLFDDERNLKELR